MPAQAESTSHDIEQLLADIWHRYGYDFRNYAPASLRRRIFRAVEREELLTVADLRERLLRDPACMARFIGNLSVRVTAMFRDPGFYRCVRQHVVPFLRTYPFVRVWHAGCSTGEEVYSLAILLHEEGLYGRTRLYATDISDHLLERAARGIFPLSTMRENTQNYQRSGGKSDFSAYYSAGGRHAIFRKSLRENMVFSHHNLVSDGPFNEFHLVLCRNVMIYFNPTLRDRVHHLLYDSLIRFGVLGLGARENMEPSPLARSYSPISAQHRLYRKDV